MAKQTLLSAFFQPPCDRGPSRSDGVDATISAHKHSKRKRRQIAPPSVSIADAENCNDINTLTSNSAKPNEVDVGTMQQLCQMENSENSSVTLSPTCSAPVLVLDQNMINSTSEIGISEGVNNSSLAASSCKNLSMIHSNSEESARVSLSYNLDEFETTIGNSQTNENLSEYEKLRLRNIKRNHERLVALGLADPTSNPMSSLMGGNDANKGSRKSQSKKRRRGHKGAGVGIAQTTRTSTLPLRRSARHRGIKVSERGSIIDDMIGSSERLVEKEPEQDEEKFKDSPLVQYEITPSFTPVGKIEQEEKGLGPISSLVPSGQTLLSPKANHAIYSLDIFKATSLSGNNGDSRDSLSNSASSSIDWIVGAGKAGIISIWNHSSIHHVSSSGTGHEGEEASEHGAEPIISWKGHGGRWIADARFVLPSGKSGSNIAYNRPSHLLTAANDGCVCLWDVRSISCQTGAPKCISTTSKTLHRGGIFSMDISAGNSNDIHVCTGSKDKTVAVTTLESITHGKACKPLFVSHHHSAKVGCVAMQQLQLNSIYTSQLIGSASDDGLVAIHDQRCNTAVASMTNAHEKPHSIVWHPCKEHLFMTAGYDEVIKLWDKRDLSVPMLSFSGHVPLTIKKQKRIHRPAFIIPTNKCNQSNVNKDDYILSGGEESGCLSIFKYDSDTSQHNDDGASDTSLGEEKISVFSRGCLPDKLGGDVGSIAIHGSNAAIAVDGGNILILSPQ